jgi:hypothetical protein
MGFSVFHTSRGSGSNTSSCFRPDLDRGQQQTQIESHREQQFVRWIDNMNAKETGLAALSPFQGNKVSTLSFLDSVLTHHQQQQSRRRGQHPLAPEDALAFDRLQLVVQKLAHHIKSQWRKQGLQLSQDQIEATWKMIRSLRLFADSVMTRAEEMLLRAGQKEKSALEAELFFPQKK